MGLRRKERITFKSFGLKEKVYGHDTKSSSFYLEFNLPVCMRSSKCIRISFLHFFEGRVAKGAGNDLSYALLISDSKTYLPTINGKRC